MIKSSNTAKAIIIENNQVLLLKKVYKDSRIIFTLPGGTQEPGETLEAAVIREAFEEANARVEVIHLAHVYEHQSISRSTPDEIKHKVEFAFLCRLIPPYTLQNGPNPDPNQDSVEWISLNTLPSLVLNPKRLNSIILSAGNMLPNFYLGLLEP